MKTNWIGFAAMGVMAFFMTGSAFAQPVCTLDTEALVGPMTGSTVQGYAHLCADNPRENRNRHRFAFSVSGVL